MIRGKIYVSGGEMPGGDPGAIVRFLYVYDPVLDTWTRKADMPRPISRGTSGVIGDQLYVLTGLCGPTSCRELVSRRFYRYDPVSDKWDISLPWCPEAHTGGASGIIGGKFYVAAGSDRTNTATNLLHVFDPATRRWATKAPIPRARRGPGGAVLQDKLYVIGGYTSVYSKAVHAYDPVKNIWTSRADLPTARASLAARRITVGSQSYILAVGGGGYGTAGSANELFKP